MSEAILVADEIVREVERQEPPTGRLVELDGYVSKIEKFLTRNPAMAAKFEHELRMLQLTIDKATRTAEAWLNDTAKELETRFSSERLRRTYQHTYDELR